MKGSSSAFSESCTSNKKKKRREKREKKKRITLTSNQPAVVGNEHRGSEQKDQLYIKQAGSCPVSVSVHTTRREEKRKGKSFSRGEKVEAMQLSPQPHRTLVYFSYWRSN